jgi:hypothetical protein
MDANNKVWKKEEIKDKILLDDKWLCRGIVAIFNKQTAEEQTVEETIKDNGVGFTGADGHLLTSFAKQYISKGYLSDKQISWARRKMIKYAGQLAKIANGKI